MVLSFLGYLLRGHLVPLPIPGEYHAEHAYKILGSEVVIELANIQSR